MAQAKHIIHKQHLHLNFHGGIVYAGLQGTLNSWLHEHLLPAMEDVLDDLDQPSRRIRLDQLQLEAGTISGEDWEDQLTRNICADLRRQIREMAYSSEPLSVDDEKSDPDFPASYTEADKATLVLHYLETGTLPWHASGLQATQLLEWLHVLIGDGYFSEQEGRLFLVNHPWAFRRLLMQSKPAALEAWFMKWDAAETRKSLPQILRAARRIFGNRYTALSWAYSFLFHLFTSAETSSSRPLWQSWMEEYIPGDSDIFPLLLKYAEQITNQEISIDQWTIRMEEISTRMHEIMDNPEALIPAKKEPGKPESVRQDGYYINNAGLVIIHPFLLAWFTQLNLYAEGAWINEEAQRRGVLLLHYLATGRSEMAEYELPLCKILAGYPMDQPVEAVLEPTEEEMAETTSLLEHVISQWPILKTTSPEGLQQTFLMRDGKLSRNDNGWLLQVEQKAFDMLLDHLPWGIGVVKNSWMNDILFTEWM